MKPRRRGQPIVATLAALGLVTAASPARAQETTDYFIRQYELTVEPRTGSPDIRVTMDITYEIRSGTKSEGFKYIGDFKATAVRGEDADGRAITTSVERQRETLIRWRFRPAGPGEKRVRISFTIPAALSGSLEQNVFEAGWAGIFKVPVRTAIYRLMLPEGWSEGSIITRPSQFTRTSYRGRSALELRQTPLRDSTFAVTLRPGITEGARSLSNAVRRQRGVGSELAAGLIFLIFFGVGAFVVIAIARAKRWKNGRSWDSSSSCAGGSSCSSGCGGGGCGGGCGG